MPAEGRIVFGIISFFLVLFLIDLYIFRGVKTIFSTSSFPVKPIATWVYWSVNLSFLIIALYTIFSFSFFKKHTPIILEVAIALLLLLYVPKLVFGFFLLCEDIFRLFRAMGIEISRISSHAASPAELFD